jgi:periplasmic protein TonB
MFNNLIESSSHTREFKRRGSFVLFTTATYILLFVVAGVISIYAYDAQLSDPSSELELISYVPLQPDRPIPEPVRVRRSNPPAGAAEGPRSTRPVLIDQTNNPLNMPHDVSAVASTIPPARPGTEIGRTVMELSGTGPGESGGSAPISGAGGTPVIDVGTPPPPQPPVERIVPKVVVSKGPITGLAIFLPKPPYPQIAKQARADGPVNVQVLVDENGKVISAKAVKGHPLLLAAAQQAALAARFTPTKLGDQAVKVSGMITYNFVLQ